MVGYLSAVGLGVTPRVSGYIAAIDSAAERNGISTTALEHPWLRNKPNGPRTDHSSSRGPLA